MSTSGPIHNPTDVSTRSLTMPDGTEEAVTMTNWHWRVWDETKVIKRYSTRALLEEVMVLDEGWGTEQTLMGCLEALVDIDMEKARAAGLLTD